jgi:cell fate (sporulation/competence/biofilm development) regulator YmcA (YheA/YmcA/DUF963 family)
LPFDNDVEKKEIKDYAHEIQEIIKDLDPVLIYFYQVDVAKAMRKVFDQRGERWKDWFIEEVTSTQYGKHRGLKRFEGMVAYQSAYQALTDELFSECEMKKLAIENSPGDWASYRRQILDFLSIPFIEDDPIPEGYLERFIGTYRDEKDAYAVKLENGSLLIYGFWWPKSRLIPKEGNAFYIEALCLELYFEEDTNGVIGRIKIGGREIEDFVGRILRKL